MAKSIEIAIGCTTGLSLLLLLYLGLHSNMGWSKSYPLMSSTMSNQVGPVVASDYMPQVANSTRHQLLLLHRQKRYLVFPEGSSFQLVFDLIIPIVDYTNFAILGVTCAVAWELPSKPPSEILENLRTRLHDGTLGTIRRNDSIQETLEMVNGDFVRTTTNWQSTHDEPTSAAVAAAAPAPAPAAAAPSATTYATNAHSNPYYSNLQSGGGTSAYANSPNGQQQAGSPTNWHARQSIPKWRQWADRAPQATASYPSTVSGTNTAPWSDNWWQRNKARVQQNWRTKQLQWNTYERPSSSYTQNARKILSKPPKHHIFPVFGKRRRRRRRAEQQQQADEDTLRHLHLRQHISSRRLLYGKIERLYKARQLNGTACIQRALCESAYRQRRAAIEQGAVATEPQGFTMELLSAIFQLPDSNEADELLDEFPSHYVAAHRTRADCRQVYGDCSHAFWL